VRLITYIILFLFLPLFSSAQEKIYFNSANPFSFKDIITNPNLEMNQAVYGILTMPDDFDSTLVCPLVIAFAGSNGWSTHHYEYLELYRSSGIATFEVASFNSRGVSSTVGSQVDVTTAMMVLDAYKAFEVLSLHKNIDTNNIGITGWSLGGGVTLFSAWTPLKNAINANVSFAAHLALYPPCIAIPTILDFGTAPIHILIGELDNWTPSDACLELINQMPKNSNISLTIYPNAHHSFDRDEPPKVKDNGYILEDCRFSMNEDGLVVMNFLNIPMSTPFLQKIGLSMCAKRGPTYGGNNEAKHKSLGFSKDFMVQNLLN
jgi:dienelactone hydrolase